MIDLYYAPTANGFRASVALEECGLAWRPHPVDLYRGEQQAAAFLGINPLGAIPVIVDHEGPRRQTHHPHPVERDPALRRGKKRPSHSRERGDGSRRGLLDL